MCLHHHVIMSLLSLSHCHSVVSCCRSVIVVIALSRCCVMLSLHCHGVVSCCHHIVAVSCHVIAVCCCCCIIAMSSLLSHCRHVIIIVTSSLCHCHCHVIMLTLSSHCCCCRCCCCHIVVVVTLLLLSCCCCCCCCCHVHLTLLVHMGMLDQGRVQVGHLALPVMPQPSLVSAGNEEQVECTYLLENMDGQTDR